MTAAIESDIIVDRVLCSLWTTTKRLLSVPGVSRFPIWNISSNVCFISMKIYSPFQYVNLINLYLNDDILWLLGPTAQKE